MSAIDRSLKSFPNVWNQAFPESVSQPLRQEAAKRFRKFQLPETPEEWAAVRPELYRKAAAAIRLKIDHSLPLDYEETGTIRMDGFSIRKISFCAAPGRYVTANLYIPDGSGPFPAIVNVHGHMLQGKVAAKIQVRAQIFAKLGYVCLVPDAFGAGERATIHGVPEYHGMYLGASLMNAGETLMGIQVADNMRAIDLLQSLPFVDRDRIGVTGGSGGGNQTMYIAAMDDRVKAAVPVCSVGSYEVYVRTANCFCEVMPGGLTFTEESGILALAAPRALKICSNIDDGQSFCVKEMLRSCYEAQKVFRVCGAEDKFSHEAFPGTHGYWPEIMESAVGFFDLHLKGIGHGMAHEVPDGASLPEPELMVWEAGKAPAKLKSLCKWTNEKAEELAAQRKQGSDTATVKRNLADLLVRTREIRIENADVLPEKEGWQRYSIDAGEVMIPVLFRPGKTGRCRIMASDLDKEKLAGSRIYQKAKNSGDAILLFDPYGSGELYTYEFSLGAKQNYHNLTRYCIWFGFSMFGIWVQEYNLLAQWAEKTFGIGKFAFEGLRDAGAAAIFAAAISGKADAVTAEKTVCSLNLVASKFSEEAATLALAVQDILCHGDLSTAIALSGADVKLISPMHGNGENLSGEEQAAFLHECRSEAERFGQKQQIIAE